jgi:hypothetical protein
MKVPKLLSPREPEKNRPLSLKNRALLESKFRKVVETREPDTLASTAHHDQGCSLARASWLGGTGGESESRCREVASQICDPS